MCWCFCFKQSTAYEMRISDWGSGVCSSDLRPAGILPDHGRADDRPRRRRHGRPERAGMTTHEHADGKAIDPVCGMAVDPATTPHHATHDGTDYHFCSAGCRTKFLADRKSTRLNSSH